MTTLRIYNATEATQFFVWNTNHLNHSVKKSYLAHAFLRCVVSVHVASLYEFRGQVHQLWEVVGSVGKLLILDAQRLQVAENVVHKFILVLARVGVVEAHNELACNRVVRNAIAGLASWRINLSTAIQ